MKKILRPARKVIHLSNRVLQKVQNVGSKVEQKVSTVIDADGTFSYNAKVRDISDVIYGINRTLYNSDPISPALPKIRKSAVNLFVPTIDSSAMFGGIATAIRVAEKIATKTNRDLRFVCVDRPGIVVHANAFLQSIGSEFVVDEKDMIDVSGRKGTHYAYVDLRPDDINIATAWWTAQQLSMMQLSQPFVYLIQDFEPIFYNYSDLYVYAKQTYEQGNYIALCNTKLVQQYLKTKGFDNAVKNSVVFEPAVDREQFKPNKAEGKKRNLFIYARPNVARNLYIHALNLVDQAFANKILNPNDWEVFMAGEAKAPSIKLNSGIIAQNLGKLNMKQYAKLAGETDLAISLMMAPHPSYPPLELAVSGAAVVTSAYSIKTELSMYSENIFVAELNSSDLLEKLEEAAKLSKEDCLKRAVDSKIAGDWDQTLEPAINELLNKLELN